MVGLIFAMAIGAQALTTPELTAAVPPVVRLYVARVHLGDIVTVEPATPCSALLSAIDLGPAPLPGDTMVLRRVELSAMVETNVQQGRTRERPTCHLRLDGAESVVLSSEGQPADINELEQRAMETLAAALGQRFDHVAISPVIRGGAPLAVLPDTTYEFSAFDTTRPRARMAVDVIVREPEHPVWIRPVWFQVQAMQRTWVLDEDLSAGRELAGARKHIATVDVAAIRGSAVAEDFAFTDRIAKVPLQSGSVLTEEAVAEEPDVLAGHSVALRFRSGVLEVQVAALALQSGFKGDRVRVRNERSNEDTVGVVNGRADVVVEP